MQYRGICRKLNKAVVNIFAKCKVNFNFGSTNNAQLPQVFWTRLRQTLQRSKMQCNKRDVLFPITLSNISIGIGRRDDIKNAIILRRSLPSILEPISAQWNEIVNIQSLFPAERTKPTFADVISMHLVYLAQHQNGDGKGESVSTPAKPQ